MKRKLRRVSLKIAKTFQDVLAQAWFYLDDVIDKAAWADGQVKTELSKREHVESSRSAS